MLYIKTNFATLSSYVLPTTIKAPGLKRYSVTLQKFFENMNAKQIVTNQVGYKLCCVSTMF